MTKAQKIGLMKMYEAGGTVTNVTLSTNLFKSLMAAGYITDFVLVRDEVGTGRWYTQLTEAGRKALAGEKA